MKRLMIVVTVVSLLCAGAVFAQQHQQHHPQQGQQMQGQDDGGMQMEMMGGGGMMGQMGMMGRMMPMMNAPDVAAWNGMTYVLSGMKLEKFNADLESERTIEFEQMPGMMQGGMMDGGMMGGSMMQQGQQAEDGEQQGGMMGGGMMQGGMMNQNMMQMMHRMHRARAMSKSSIAADGEGVYVLRGPTMTVYDHDLNELRSADVVKIPENAGQCMMCRKMMQKMQQDGGMMGGGMMGGGMMGHQWSEPRERPLPMGVVHMYQRPPEPAAGRMMFRVNVLTADKRIDEDASINGYIYPKGQPGNGKAVAFGAGPGGHMIGSVQLQAAGQYELAVRVKRPDMEDRVVYYDVSVGQ